MPLTVSNLIATVGAANANSYVTLAEAQTYHDLNLGSDAWFEAEEGDQIRALIKAARRLNQETWLGSRVIETQALAWPRVGVAKVDAMSVGAIAYSGWPGLVGRTEYSATEIPQAVKDAQCELALAYLNGFTDGDTDEISEFSESDGVSVKFRQSRADGGSPSSVNRLIAPLIAGAILVRG